MKDLIAADRYARALFEVCCLSHQDIEVRDELDAFVDALESSPQTEKFFKNPHFTLEEKRRSLVKIYQRRFHAHQETFLNFLGLLLEKGRFNLIREVAREFRRIVDEERGLAVAQIRSAVPLDARTEEAITARLEKIAGYKVTLEKEVDPALIGGLAVKVRNRILDGTVKKRIESLKKELTGKSVI